MIDQRLIAGIPCVKRHLPFIFGAMLLSTALVLTFPSAARANTFPLSQNSFNLWWTASTEPYLIGSTGICVPVGGQEASSNYLGATERNPQQASGMSFYGCFKGGTNAPSASNEEAVFLATDVTTWHGTEMGFVKTLNDNALKAYLQSGGTTVWAVLSVGDNGYHAYKCQVNYTDHSAVDFYVDGVYRTTLKIASTNYWANSYYYVGTTHRTSNTWVSTGQQIEMYSLCYYD